MSARLCRKTHVDTNEHMHESDEAALTAVSVCSVEKFLKNGDFFFYIKLLKNAVAQLKGRRNST